MTMCLPIDKYDNLQAMIATWVRKQSVQKCELLSLIGHLAHACKVVPPGRTFLRRMIDLSTMPKHLDHWVRLNKDFHSDLLWWDMFLPSWNRHSLLSAHGHPPPEIVLATDASGSWGCGAVWPPHWFHLPWTSDWSGTNIAVKELVSIILAAAVWGEAWAHRRVLVLSDNSAVVQVFKSHMCRDSDMMNLLRCLHLIEAKWDVVIWAQHIPRKSNIAADALSRNSLQVFYQNVPDADQRPTPLPPALIRLVLGKNQSGPQPTGGSC